MDINKYPISKIKDLLGEKIGTEMLIILNKLQDLRFSISAQNLDRLSLSKLQSLSPRSSASGTRSIMISRILSRTEQGKELFLLKDSTDMRHCVFQSPIIKPHIRSI